MTIRASRAGCQLFEIGQGSLAERTVTSRQPDATERGDGLTSLLRWCWPTSPGTIRSKPSALRTIQEAAHAIPDARQRLSYISEMTEQAASKVLNATDIAKPLQDKLHSGAESLRARWDRLYANQLSPDEFRALAGETREFLGDVVSDTRETNAQLLEIMMAQDFQDLTGQVIKRMMDVIQEIERQLLMVLLENIPEQESRPKRENQSLLNGPQVDTSKAGVVASQDQVDDLLDSLGF